MNTNSRTKSIRKTPRNQLTFDKSILSSLENERMLKTLPTLKNNSLVAIGHKNE
jgi:hypothetical protein